MAGGADFGELSRAARGCSALAFGCYDARVKRRLFNAIAVVSKVLCVTILALWVRSYWCADCVSWSRGHTNYPNPPPPSQRSWNDCWYFGIGSGKLHLER